MFNSLDIQNYRNLKKLTISSLGQINLITGKNNTGKSTLLEAVAIYATKGGIIDELLNERGEYFDQNELRRRSMRENQTKDDVFEKNIKALSSLFTNRLIGFKEVDAILIGCIDNTLFGEQQSYLNSISLRFRKYIYEISNGEEEMINTKRVFLDDNSDQRFENAKMGFEVKIGNETYTLSQLDGDRLYRFRFKSSSNNFNIQFIKAGNINAKTNGNLFDNIALTEKENYVIDALKIIEPSTERIAFTGDDFSNDRKAIIKLSTSKDVLPLQSMGDGINRILTIILALVNSDNGFLLIDEFENGLHYTVQEKLWRIIFELSQKLNVQVFATTHSSDCINGFEATLNSTDSSLGKLIRLENDNNDIKYVDFDASELKTANERNIEIR
ncbi:MAG: AAA family ATPase [Campylobacteraceae bacterium]|jgi:AAA15 family ATPase/GTPase|nr:AAA family ATPase [Campylobacteraceae bacterium]